MTRFDSPALHQPDLHISAAAMRGVLGAVALVGTAALWFAVGAQAGRFGENDTALHVDLEPVVVSGQRLMPGAATMAMGTVPGAECANQSAVR